MGNNCCEIGSHKCAVVLKVPDNIEIWKVCGNEKKKTISADRCLVPAIKALWAAGIPTVNSCCGHGIHGADIFIEPRYIKKMENEKNEKSY